MKKIKNLLAVSILEFTLLALSLALPFSALAIGLVTEPIVIKDALKGGEFQETLMIVGTQQEDVSVAFEAEGDIASWAKFYLPNDLKNSVSKTILTANGSLSISVVFSIPQDAPNGTYEGIVRVTQGAKEEKLAEGSSVNISQRIDRKVTIIVSDKEIIDVKASIIPEKYDLVKNEALKIRVIYDNQSNISLRPQIQVKIKSIDTDTAVYNAIFPYPETEPSVKPSTMYEIPALEIPTSGFASGKYRTEIIILQGNENVFEKSFVFSLGIFKPSSVMAAIGGIFGNNFTINWFIIGGAIVIILALIMIKLARKKNHESS